MKSVNKINLGKLTHITHLEDDLIFGGVREQLHQQEIEDFFECNLQHTNQLYGQYCSFDFEDSREKIRIELKSRRNVSIYDYNTTVIGHNKIQKAKKNSNNWDYIFIFEFKEGLYYIRYDEYLANLKGKYFKRLNGEIKHNIHIPVNKLKPLKKQKISNILLECINNSL